MQGFVSHPAPAGMVASSIAALLAALPAEVMQKCGSAQAGGQHCSYRLECCRTGRGVASTSCSKAGCDKEGH